MEDEMVYVNAGLYEVDGEKFCVPKVTSSVGEVFNCCAEAWERVNKARAECYRRLADAVENMTGAENSY